MNGGLVEAVRKGAVSPQIALARLVLAGALPAQDELDALAAVEPAGSPVVALADLARPRRARLAALGAVAARGLDPDGPDLLAATAALFDRLAAEEPEAAVAFYSLGDPALLDAATAELLAVIRAWVPVAGADVLDLGCGIGRVAIPLAREAGSVVGLDLSAAMVAEARARAGSLANARFAVGGRNLDAIADASLDLVLAIDSFPYVVRAGAAVLDGLVAEIARVLRPGGRLVVFNWSYRGDAAADRVEAERVGGGHGLALERAGDTPFGIWDATGYQLVRGR